MPKRHHKSSPDQLDLLADRSKQFELMEAFEFLRLSSQIAMLLRIFVAVGKYNRKVIPISTLARRCGVGMKSAYRIKCQLEEMGLIFAKAIGGRSFEWSIGWANVWDLHEEWKLSPASEDAEMEETDDLETAAACLTHETTGLTGETRSLMYETARLTSETTGLTSETHIRSIELTSLKTSSSSSASADDDAVDGLVLRLLNCGVTHVGPAIDVARERGMSIEQISAVIDHYTAEGNSGRWSPNVLVDRLTREHMRLAQPDQGWFGENPEWTAAAKRQAQTAAQQQAVEASRRDAQPAAPSADVDELEARYGAQLDAMLPAERRQLLAGESAFIVGAVARGGDDIHKSKLWRPRFLEALKAKGNR